MKRGLKIVILTLASMGWLACGGGGQETDPARSTARADAPVEDAYVASVNSEAFRNFSALAEQGDAEGQKNLAYLYYQGQGVPRDYDKAFKWFQKAADQGEPVAQMTLGVMYSVGQGVPQDYVRAHSWLSAAAAKETPGAQTRADDVASRMTPEQLAESAELAKQHP